MKIGIEIWGVALVGLVGLAIIGSIGYYLGREMPGAIEQSAVNELIDKCVVYNSSPGRIPFKFDEIQTFLKKMDAEPSENIPRKLLTSFNVCRQDLRVNLKKYELLDRS